MANENNQALFTTVVGLIFGQLYDAFPMKTEIDEVKIVESVAPFLTKSFGFYSVSKDVRFDWFMNATLSWLRDEGFIRTKSASSTEEVVLTSKTFAILKTVPRGEEGGETLGAALSGSAADFIGEVGTDVRKGMASQIADFAGQVIAGAVKGLWS